MSRTTQQSKPQFVHRGKCSMFRENIFEQKRLHRELDQNKYLDCPLRSKGPLSSARHKALHFAWACQHQHWNVDGWKHVAYPDETRLQLNLADERVRVWRQPHESMDRKCEQGTVQACGGSVMVWSICIWRDMGPLIRLDTTLTGERYASIPSNHLLPFMSIVHFDGLGEVSAGQCDIPHV
ncbi:transposable element Tcb2 transposase [Trichonephila clavipes]|nr:transposable element Tcb2 transposase [Trichonephila clavipes]